MIKFTKYLISIICLALYCINSSFAQTVNKFDFERIEDNSFLIEEAYNQDPGVIQHISAFQYMKGNTWIYTFTDEWPVPGRKHQLSTTIPLLNNGETGLGDLAINYRYQAIFTNRFAFSPRFSLLLPSGNYKKGLGEGVPGYQLSLPFSYLLSRKIATHYNLGVTFTPDAKRADGSRYNQTIYNWGLSIILLLNKNFNFMFEVVGNTTLIKTPNTTTTTSGSLFINPGIRYAFNFKSGLQIVPGLALPIGLGSSKGASGLFAYLSFEHPLWKPKN
jgi:Putative MetA-pathway of phenol degradation